MDARADDASRDEAPPAKEPDALWRAQAGRGSQRADVRRDDQATAFCHQSGSVLGFGRLPASLFGGEGAAAPTA